jgi:hypothetical protein
MTEHLNQLASEHIATYGFLTLGTVEYTLMDTDGTIEVILQNPAPIGNIGDTPELPEPNKWILKPGDTATITLKSPVGKGNIKFNFEVEG